MILWRDFQSNKVNKFSILWETKERKKIVNLPDKYY